MDLDSRTLARELRIAFSTFSQAALPCPFLMLLSAAALLAGPGLLRLLSGRFVLCRLLQHHWMVLVRLPVRGFRWSALFRCGRGSSRSGMFLSTLRGFLFLFLFFRLLLDTRQFTQHLYAFFGRFPTPRQLHAENLLDYGVELRPSRIAQGFQLVPYYRKRTADRAPFVEIRADF